MTTNAQRFTLALTALGGLAITYVVASKPFSPQSEALDLLVPGTPESTFCLATNSTTAEFYYWAGSSPRRKVCFPHQTQLEASADTSGMVVITESPRVTIGTGLAEPGCHTSNRYGACAPVLSGQSKPIEVDRRVLGRRLHDDGSAAHVLGAMPGVCSKALKREFRIGGYAARAKCYSDNDCTYAGSLAGATCKLTPLDSELEEACAFGAWKPASGTAAISCLRVDK